MSCHRPERLRGREFYAGGQVPIGFAVLAPSLWFREGGRKATQVLLAPGFEMGDPDGAVDRTAAYGTVPLRENLPGRTFEAVFLMGAVEIASAKQIIAHARRAIGGPDFSCDGFCRILTKIDGALALAHEWAKKTAHIGLSVIERFGLELARFEFGNGLEYAAYRRFRDLMP